MAAQEVLEEPPEPVKYKKWILKVSIHCEGCKRKVKKILQEVQGVFEIEIDTKQQKVAVVGDVEADTLLRKLNKAGRHAELWPINPEQKEKMQVKLKPNEKPTQQESHEDTGKAAGNEQEAPEQPIEKAGQVQEPSKNTQGGGAASKSQEPSKNNQGGGGSAAKIGGESGGAAKTGGESSVTAKVIEGSAKTCNVDKSLKESKTEKKPDNKCPAAAQPPVVAEKKGSENDTTNSAGKVGGNDGGNSGKKKKKKGQNGNNTGGEQSSTAQAGIGSQNHEDGAPTGSVLANHSPPHHHSYYDYTPLYDGPPPVYAVSYNTSHPRSYTASYYAAQAPNSYVYSYSGGYSGLPEREPPPPPSDLDSYPRQPLDSFEIFSEENPNGCSVM